MLLRSLLLSVSLLCATGLAQAEVVEFPTDDFWRAVSRAFYEGEPDFEALAKQSDLYRRADEFSRSEVLAQEVERIRAEHEAISSDFEVRLRANIRLGDYDAARGGFPISLFTPGTYLDVGPGLSFRNAADYAILPMTIEEAKGLRDREARGGQTSALLMLGDFGKAPGRVRELVANVYSFEYVDESGNILASLSKPPAPRLGDAEQRQLVDKTHRDILALAGLPPIGSDWPTVRDALVANYGYAVSHAQAYDDAKVVIQDGALVTEDLKGAKRLRIGFGNDHDLVSRMFSRQSVMARAKIPEGQIDMGFTGRALDCQTPDVADACGVLIFEEQGGKWILTAAEGVTDLPAKDYGLAFADIAADALAAFTRSDLHVAYFGNWVGGAQDSHPGSHVMAARYVLGDALEEQPYYLRPMEPWPGRAAYHEITTYAVSGARNRTPLIFTLAPKLAPAVAAEAEVEGQKIGPVSLEDLAGLNAHTIFEAPRFLPAIREALGATDPGTVQFPASMKTSPYQDSGEWFVSGGCRPYVCDRQFTNVLVRKADGAIGIVYSKDGKVTTYGPVPEPLPPVFTFNFGAVN